MSTALQRNKQKVSEPLSCRHSVDGGKRRRGKNTLRPRLDRSMESVVRVRTFTETWPIQDPLFKTAQRPRGAHPRPGRHSPLTHKHPLTRTTDRTQGNLHCRVNYALYVLLHRLSRIFRHKHLSRWRERPLYTHRHRRRKAGLHPPPRMRFRTWHRRSQCGATTPTCLRYHHLPLAP